MKKKKLSDCWFTTDNQCFGKTFLWVFTLTPQVCVLLCSLFTIRINPIIVFWQSNFLSLLMSDFLYLIGLKFWWIRWYHKQCSKLTTYTKSSFWPKWAELYQWAKILFPLIHSTFVFCLLAFWIFWHSFSWDRAPGIISSCFLPRCLCSLQSYFCNFRM